MRRLNQFPIFLAALTFSMISFDSQHASSQTMTDDCRYTAAYRQVYEAGSRRPLKSDSDTAESVLNSVLQCVLGIVSASGRADSFNQSRDKLVSAMESLSVPLQKSILEIELAAAIGLREPNNGERAVDAVQLQMLAKQRAVARRIYRNLQQNENGLKPLYSEIDQLVTKNPSIHEVMKENQWKQAFEPSKFENQRKAYHAACKSHGVPIPPPINSSEADRKWTQREDLEHEVEHYFIGTELKGTHIRSYTEKQDSNTKGGFCVSFVRAHKVELSSSDYEQLMGTICTNHNMTSACFFDSYGYDKDGKLIQLTLKDAESYKFEDFAHPMDYEDRCTDCHRGQNAFIGHPDSKIGNFLNRLYPKCDATKGECLGPTKLFEPVPVLESKFIATLPKIDATMAGYWSNGKPLPQTSGLDRCFTCHALADNVGHAGNYCNHIFINALNYTMPARDKYPGFGQPRIGHPNTGSISGNKNCFIYPDGLDEKEHIEKFKSYFASVRALNNYYCVNGKFQDPGAGERCSKEGWLKRSEAGK